LDTGLGSRLRELRGEASQMATAQKLGVSQSAIGHYERGDQLPGAAFLLAVSKHYNVSIDWLLTGKGQMKAGVTLAAPAAEAVCDVDLIYVPMVKARLAAGTGSFETSAEVERRYAFRSDFLNSRGHPSKMVLMHVAGDSMDPEIKDGDVVLIDQSQKQPVPGRVFAVGVEDLVYLKMIDTLPGKLLLKSYNPAYPPIEVDARGDLSDGVRIIGHVIWVGRELR